MLALRMALGARGRVGSEPAQAAHSRATHQTDLRQTLTPGRAEAKVRHGNSLRCQLSLPVPTERPSGLSQLPVKQTPPPRPPGATPGLPQGPARSALGCLSQPRRRVARAAMGTQERTAPGKATEKPHSSLTGPTGAAPPPGRLRAEQSHLVQRCVPCQDVRPCRQGLGWGWPDSVAEGGGAAA